MTDHVWDVGPPQQADDGTWTFSVSGRGFRVYGPYPNYEEVGYARLRLFARWKRRAAQLGGDCHKQTDVVWMVSLPEGTPTRGLEPMRLPMARVFDPPKG